MNTTIAPHSLSNAALLEVRDLRRSFGETRALDSCTLMLQPGEIHALVGENGSGKSTLIKILSGIICSDSGDVAWKGASARFAKPRDAQRAGIATVFQETLVLPDLSVHDNIVLGLDDVVRRRSGQLREAQLVREALAVLGVATLDIEQDAGSLSLANRQLVGIARSLLRPWRLLILDESTSALDVDDRDRLFAALRRFRSDGRTVLFVSHRMDEVTSLADRTTVLRSGRTVGTFAGDEATTERLLEVMSSREGARAAEGHAAAHSRAANGPTVLTWSEFALKTGRAPLSLELRAGEILGVAGLEGHGQVAFLECAAGRRASPCGTVAAERGAIHSPRDAARARIAFLPRDRKTEGIFAPLTVTDNITVSGLRRLARWGLVSRQQRRRVAVEVGRNTKVKMASPDSPISSLSGGNQQKALLGRLIATDPQALVLNDPLRGVDLGAKRDCYEVLADLAGKGMAILLLSTELAELCQLCDRVVVFHNQGVEAVIGRAELSEQALIAAMFGKYHKAPDVDVNA
ncbi:MAG: sugar ABC transporter ATP-binding protein [Ancalomicrobiaceae bacterium]|nr:sugar ABC transporter ATP-binding protein [Ancalomicrobiaceae bacterium]